MSGGDYSVRGNYLKKLLHGQHDSDRVYLEKMQATIASIEIRKELAIRERISNI